MEPKMLNRVERSHPISGQKAVKQQLTELLNFKKSFVNGVNLISGQKGKVSTLSSADLKRNELRKQPVENIEQLSFKQTLMKRKVTPKQSEKIHTAFNKVLITVDSR